MNENDPVVFVVDDDVSVLRALQRLLKSAGFRAETFVSAQEFLSYRRPDAPACLVLDVRMPELDGLDLQNRLAAAGTSIPTIFITGFGDIPMSVQAMKRGAVDFIPKPFNDQDLLDAIDRAIDRDVRARRERSIRDRIQTRFESLTPREREVFATVVTGMLNKQIAVHLGVTEKTIKVHRARVMQKMQAGSLAELVRLAERLGITPSEDRLEAAPRD
jgi:RNA polymerase sigma factor (sigma-70 family)